MQFTLLFVLACVGYVDAQTTTSSCGAQSQLITDTCVGSTGAILSACPVNDWSCMCTAQQSVVTCYNNCPGDPDRVAANSNLVAWCNARDVASSQSVAISGTKTTTAMITTTASLITTVPVSSSSSTGSSVSARSTGFAVAMAAPANGLLAAAGIFGALL